jgi:hypothetical protein
MLDFHQGVREGVMCPTEVVILLETVWTGGLHAVEQ